MTNSEIETQPVPAEGLTRLTSSSSLYLRPTKRSHIQRGQVRWGPTLNRRWHHVRVILRQHFQSPNAGKDKKHLRAEMILGALRIQGAYGSLFASAKLLAANVGASEKTWDRLLADLRRLKLVTTRRLVRHDGKESTNDTDLTALWTWLLELLNKTFKAGHFNVTVEVVGGQMWVKTGGIWEILCNQTTVKGERQ